MLPRPIIKYQELTQNLVPSTQVDSHCKYRVALPSRRMFSRLTASVQYGHHIHDHLRNTLKGFSSIGGRVDSTLHFFSTFTQFYETILLSIYRASHCIDPGTVHQYKSNYKIRPFSEAFRINRPWPLESAIPRYQKDNTLRRYLIESRYVIDVKTATLRSCDATLQW